METFNMSRTYRKTFRGKFTTEGKMKAESRNEPRRGYTIAEWLVNMSARTKSDWLCYSNMPSHWAHDYHTVPRRAEERELIGKILKGELDYDEVVFPDGKKPVVYYW
jgi:hypothetical protein